MTKTDNPSMTRCALLVYLPRGLIDRYQVAAAREGKTISRVMEPVLAAAAKVLPTSLLDYLK